MRSRVIRAPTTSWWWKVTTPPAEGPGPRLADVVEERGEAEQPVRRGLVDHRQGVGEHVLVPVDRVLLEGERRAARGGTRRPGRSRPRTTARSTGG